LRRLNDIPGGFNVNLLIGLLSYLTVDPCAENFFERVQENVVQTLVQHASVAGCAGSMLVNN
jgi:hypothetical protein